MKCVYLVFIPSSAPSESIEFSSMPQAAEKNILHASKEKYRHLVSIAHRKDVNNTLSPLLYHGYFVP